MVHSILRIYSYLVHTVIVLGFLALGAVAVLSTNTTFDIDMLPWSGDQLRWALLILGTLGLMSLALAIQGRLRFLFLLWTLATVYLLGRGIFASAHVFDGDEEFKWTLFALLALVLTVPGAWSRFRQPVFRPGAAKATSRR